MDVSFFSLLYAGAALQLYGVAIGVIERYRAYDIVAVLVALTVIAAVFSPLAAIAVSLVAMLAYKDTGDKAVAVMWLYPFVFLKNLIVVIMEQ